MNDPIHIDLKRDRNDYPQSTPSSECEYPMTYLEGSEALMSLPDKGEITFKFEKASSTKTVRGDETEVSCSLKLIAVTGLKTRQSKTEEPKTDEVLDELYIIATGANNEFDF